MIEFPIEPEFPIDPETGSEDDPETHEPNALDERQKFEQERSGVIGSTDSAGILGLSRRNSPLNVYRRLVGESDPYQPSLPAWLGSAMENIVSEMAAVAIGEPLRADNRQHLHPDYPFIGCHLDRRVLRRPRTIVELKTRSYRRGWGDDGTAKVPVDIYVQVQHQMAVVPSDETLVAVLFGLGHAFAVYRIPRDDEFIEQLVPKLGEFWETFVVPRVPPPATGFDVDTAAVSNTPGGNTGVIKPATPEQAAIVDTARLARMNYAQAEYAKKAAENQIRQIIGTADGITGPFGLITYKRTKDRIETAWDALAAVYLRGARRLLELANPAEDDPVVRELALIAAQLDTAQDLYTQTKPGHRQMRFVLNDPL
jgi:predicted phage-related endonuclease